MRAVLVVGVGGVTGGGKTSLCACLAVRYPGPVYTLHMDDYYHPNEYPHHRHRPDSGGIDWECIESIDFERMVADLERLLCELRGGSEERGGVLEISGLVGGVSKEMTVCGGVAGDYLGKGCEGASEESELRNRSIVGKNTLADGRKTEGINESEGIAECSDGSSEHSLMNTATLNTHKSKSHIMADLGSSDALADGSIIEMRQDLDALSGHCSQTVEEELLSLYDRAKNVKPPELPYLVLVEGILIFEYAPLQHHLTHRYFVTLTRAVAWKRRLGRDYGEGTDVANSEEYFALCLWPSYLACLGRALSGALWGELGCAELGHEVSSVCENQVNSESWVNSQNQVKSVPERRVYCDSQVNCENLDNAENWVSPALENVIYSEPGNEVNSALLNHANCEHKSSIKSSSCSEEVTTDSGFDPRPSPWSRDQCYRYGHIVELKGTVALDINCDLILNDIIGHQL